MSDRFTPVSPSSPLALGRCIALAGMLSGLGVLLWARFGLAPQAPGSTWLPAAQEADDQPASDAAKRSPPESPPGGDALALELNRRLVDDVLPLFDAYCIDCHVGKDAEGGVRLDRVHGLADAFALGPKLRAAKEMVSGRQMPPARADQPTDHERLIIEQWLTAALDYVPPDGAIDPGWFTPHRLNRTEYRNTIRDLLFIEDPAFDPAARLPEDDSGYGFDNIADVLTISPLAMEQYLDAAERALDFALGPELLFGDTPRPAGRLEGRGNGATLPGGGYLLYSSGAVHARAVAPATGDYLVRVIAWETYAGDEHASLSLRIGGKTVETFAVDAARGEPGEYAARVRLSAGTHDLAAHFTNDFYQPNVADRNLAVEAISIAGPLEEATTERPPGWVRVMGALWAPDATAPDTRAPSGARTVVSAFAQRAFRRPLADGELERLMTLHAARLASGDSPEQAVRTVLTAVLVSPNFLYRIPTGEIDPSTRRTRLDGFSLASRLSYFLWSTMPDDDLLAAAFRGDLDSDDGLTSQLRRMLADARSEAFIDAFAGQWLQLRTLDRHEVDASHFPEFDEPLRQAMRDEARLLMAETLRRDLPLTTLLRSDFTFLNERLARHYGIEGLQGDAMRRVALPLDSPRGGLLTTAAVLTLTSGSTRTSPVKRGVFVLDRILGAPPPPPPADIPRLEQSPVGPDATLREQLAAHVADPTCAVCHARLDPLGLALENFDAIGRWRTEENGRPVEPGGILPTGEAVAGPDELRAVIVARSDEFIEAFASSMLTFALGRGLEPFDRPAIRRLTIHTRAHHDRWSALIEAIVLSETFRTCRPREPRP